MFIKRHLDLEVTLAALGSIIQEAILHFYPPNDLFALNLQKIIAAFF